LAGGAGGARGLRGAGGAYGVAKLLPGDVGVMVVAILAVSGGYFVETVAAEAALGAAKKSLPSKSASKSFNKIMEQTADFV